MTPMIALLFSPGAEGRLHLAKPFSRGYSHLVAAAELISKAPSKTCLWLKLAVSKSSPGATPQARCMALPCGPGFLRA